MQLYVRPRLLNVFFVLISAHFAIAHVTKTALLFTFARYKRLDSHMEIYETRMLPALIWRLCNRIYVPLHARFAWMHVPIMHPPFDSGDNWFQVLLSFVAMLGTLLVARRLVRAVIGPEGDPALEWLALGMAYAAYFDTSLILIRNLFYPYDIPALFFFTLLILFAVKDRPVLFTLTLIPAMLNKETAIMAILVYFGLQYGRRPLTKLLAITGCMAAVALAVHFGDLQYLRHICPHCNFSSQNQIAENMRQLPNPLFYVSEASLFGYAYVPLIIFWRYIPERYWKTSVVVGAIWFAGMFLVGVLREVRIFSELSGLVLLMAAGALNNWETSRHESAVGAVARPESVYAR
jgi:hypothetical protein